MNLPRIIELARANEPMSWIECNKAIVALADDRVRLLRALVEIHEESTCIGAQDVAWDCLGSFTTPPDELIELYRKEDTNESK